MFTVWVFEGLTIDWTHFQRGLTTHLTLVRNELQKDWLSLVVPAPRRTHTHCGPRPRCVSFLRSAGPAAEPKNMTFSDFIPPCLFLVPPRSRGSSKLKFQAERARCTRRRRIISDFSSPPLGYICQRRKTCFYPRKKKHVRIIEKLSNFALYGVRSD